jgi:hypothetical protein
MLPIDTEKPDPTWVIEISHDLSDFAKEYRGLEKN